MFRIFKNMLGILVEIVVNALLFVGKPRARLVTVVVITALILVLVIVTMVTRSSV